MYHSNVVFFPHNDMAELPPELIESMKADGHQIGSDISLPSTPGLFEKVLPREKFLAIFDKVGKGELERLASVEHGHQEAEPVDYDASAKQERADLDVLRSAITEVTGKENPWIIGFASDFARGLLQYVAQARPDSD